MWPFMTGFCYLAECFSFFFFFKQERFTLSRFCKLDVKIKLLAGWVSLKASLLSVAGRGSLSHYDLTWPFLCVPEFIYGVSFISTSSFLFIVKQYSIGWICHLQVDELLGCWHFLTIICNTAVSMYAQGFTWTCASSSLGSILRSVIANHVLLRITSLFDHLRN
jgi:hypothetical protein